MNARWMMFLGIAAFLAFFFFDNAWDVDLLTKGDLNAPMPFGGITMLWVGATAVIGLVFMAIFFWFWSENKLLVNVFMVVLGGWIFFWLMVIAFLGRDLFRWEVVYTIAQASFTIGVTALMSLKQNKET